MSYGIVYGLYDPRTDELRYIGQTTKTLKQRFQGHICKYNLAKHLYSSRWIIHLRRLGLNPLIKQLVEAGSREELDSLEIKLIAEARARGERLTNITTGGKGLTGHKHSTKTKAYISAALKGKPKSTETRARISASHKGKKISEKVRIALLRAATGRVVSVETRAKLIGRKRSLATKQKMRASKLGHTVSQETRNKISASKKGVPSGRKGIKQTPEAVLKNRLSHIGLHPTFETRAKLSASLVGLMAGSKHPHYRHDISTTLILKKLRDGLTRRQIANEFRITPKLISRRLKQAERAGIDIGPKSTRARKIPTSLILQKLAEGKTKAQIAGELGMSRALVYQRLRKVT